MDGSSLKLDWEAAMIAALSGDAEAYRLLLSSMTPHIRATARSFCRRWGATDEDAEDIVQEVLLTIHTKRGTWDRSRQIGPWLGAITRNKVVDALRRRKQRVHLPLDDVIESLRVEEPEPLEDISAPELDALIGRLKSRHREIVKSVSLNGRSISETAKRFDMSEGAVRVTLHRALRALGAFYREGRHADA
jgi:RNA polymerase sigma factor (sigma-70 family)